MSLFGIISLIFAIAGLVSSVLLLWKIPSLDSVTCGSDAGSAKTDAYSGCADFLHKLPDISVIIPARNEEKNIGKLLKSLNKQSAKPIEIIVADDDSDDTTCAVACEYGASVVNTGAAPEGWIGKSWAAYSGAMASCGELLVFLDADTELSFTALEKLACLFDNASRYENSNSSDNNSSNSRSSGGSGGSSSGRIAVSVQPYHRMERFYETFSLFFNIILVKGLNSFGAFKGARKPSGLFGPVLCIKRDDYFSVDGHSSVKGHILEDMALGKLLSEKGFRLYNHIGSSIISFRMYPAGLRKLIEGWGKNFSTGAAKTPITTLISTIMWISGCFSTGAAFIPDIVSKAHVIPYWFILYWVYAAVIYLHSRRIGGFPVYTAIIFPIYAAFFTLVFIYSVFRKIIVGKVTWKGRTIDI